VKDKDYFIGKFMTGLPDFSKKKSAKNKWSLKKDGLKGRQVTDSTRVLNICSWIIALSLWLS
jgi:transcription initiation factor TFIIF subunit alpha